jgi:sulfite reductase (ferredoxin)
VADIGFFGNSRRRNNRTVPHFQVVLGGRWRDNAGSYGLAVGAVPSKVAPDVLNLIVNRYANERTQEETFQDWVTRLGKKQIRELLDPFMEVPIYETNPEYYSDWGDPREFGIGDIGVGECAGEVVSLFSMEIVRAEAQLFDAMIALDEGNYPLADSRAYEAMLLAARALLRGQGVESVDNPEQIAAQFRTRFYDTQLFFDKYAKGVFADYFFKRHEHPVARPDEEAAHKLIEQANLFVEAVHACDARLAGALTGGVTM